MTIFYPPKVIVISLKNQTDRRIRITETLNKLKFDWGFIDAIDGKKLAKIPGEYNSAKRLNYFGYDLTSGELGCFLSHREAWKKCINLNQNCLVLEDDVEPSNFLINAIDTALTVQHGWDLFRLHSIHDKKHISMGKLNTFEIIENLKDPSSAAAYLIKSSAAKKLLRYSESFYMPVDDYLECHYLHKLKILAIKPEPICITGKLPTSITGRHKPRLPPGKRLLKELYKINHGWRNFIWRIQRRLFHKKLIISN